MLRGGPLGALLLLGGGNYSTERSFSCSLKPIINVPISQFDPNIDYEDNGYAWKIKE